MRSLVALLLAATCALARPPGPDPDSSEQATSNLASPSRRPAPPPSPREMFGDFIYARFILPHLSFEEEDERLAAVTPNRDWLSKEIDRINQMQDEEENPTTFDVDADRWIPREPYLQGMLDNARIQEVPSYGSRVSEPINSQILLPQALVSPEIEPVYTKPKKVHDERQLNNTSEHKDVNFALTPLDKGYFDRDTNTGKPSPLPNQEYAMHEGGDPRTAMLLEPPRQIRQNPLSRSKTLVAENLDRLRTGLASKDYRLPVSLLPSNLRWLKIDHSNEVDHDDDDPSSLEEGHSTDKPRHVHVLESANDPAQSIYGVALLAAVGAALTMAVFGLAIGWYTLFKKAKAAADVDYPAYGVTGPTIDTSGDRKLAHSAHMYHYQHQKQQIIAMERNGMEQRSISDPESEEENEEGDYTVYECPGFATTGDMEVKNPLFSEDPTPATPGKCEVVKPQPKD